MKLIDSHAHVQFPAYDEDREAVIRRALGESVGMINVGTQYKTSEDAVKLAGEHDGIWATVGFHPSHADENAHHDPWEIREKDSGGFDRKKFFTLAKNSKVVAVGECGLDYFRIRNNESGIKEQQANIFQAQVELAIELGKPLALHCRPSKGTEDAYDDMFEILNSYSQIHNSALRGVVHFFVGSPDTAKKFLDLGFYIAFAGPITFAKEYEEVVCFVPLGRILVETDAPYASPAPYRGKRNEPLYVGEVAKKIAEVKKLALEEVADATVENTKKLFGI